MVKLFLYLCKFFLIKKPYNKEILHLSVPMNYTCFKDYPVNIKTIGFRFLGSYWLILLVLLPLLSNAQNKQFLFANYDKSNGLPHNNVMAFYRDSKGFMWIGTVEGLCRFDGYSFKIFKNDPKDTTTIADNVIKKIFEDNEGKLWINAGENLEVFNPEDETFVHHQLIFGNRLTVPVGSVGSAAYDHERNIYYANNKRGIYKYIVQKDKLITVKTIKKDIYKRMSSIITDKTGKLWIATTDSKIYGISTTDFSLTDSIIFNGSVSSLYILYVDDDNDLWFFDNYNSAGIYCYKREAGTLIHYSANSGKCRLNNNAVMGVVQDDTGLIWIATDHGGINILDKKKNVVSYIKNDPLNKRSICENSLATIYKDNQGFIWIGSFRRGFSYYHPKMFSFEYYKFELNDNQLVGFNDIGPFVEDNKGNLWIGTNGGGLFYLDRKKNTLKHFCHDPLNPESISSNIIIDLFIDSKSRLWIGTYYGGLNLFDGKGFKHFRHNPSDPSTISDDKVWEICEASDGNLWLAEHMGGVNVFDPDKKQVIEKFQGIESNTLKASTTFTVYQGSDDIMWIATVNGLRSYNLRTKAFEYFNHEPNNPNSLSNNFTSDIIEDSRGLIWIATTDGLNMYDRKSKTFRVFKQDDGLASNLILSMIEDNGHTLWVGTSSGLSNLIISKNPETNEYTYTFKNYDEANGLQGGEFNENSVFQSGKGELFFGGPNGYNVFYPADLKLYNIPSKLYFTDIQVFNQSISCKTMLNSHHLLEKPIIYAPEIRLRYNENVVTIEFADVNFLHPEHIKYSYILENFNANWYTTGSKERKITYTNLDPGEYILHVKSTRNDGTWNKKEAKLKISVLAPWWRTLLFKGTVFLLIISLILFTYYYRLYSFKKQKLVLEERVNRRTLQLSEANKMLEDRQKEIISQNKELEKHRNHLEHLVKERTTKLEEAMNKARESDMLKSAFLANMSHEIRTPMNAIVGFSSLLEDPGLSAEERSQMVEIINSNSESLLLLIDDILDLSLIEANQLVINKKSFLLNGILNQLHSYFSLCNKNSEVTIVINNTLEKENLRIYSDRERLKQIMTNLMNNACKFTKKGSIELGITKNNDLLIIYVKDTGIGIAKEDIEHLFERFRKVGNDKNFVTRGTGLGLAISKRIAELLGGDLVVKSEFGKGSVFTFWIPLRKIISKELTNTRNQGKSSKNDWENKHLLLVEDEETNYLYIDKVLINTGISISWAQNGHEAIKLVENNNRFDIVLMDIKMPVLDGLETTIKLKEMNPDLVIIAQTAYARPDDRSKFMQEGFDDYISKPIKPNELIELISKFL